MPELDDLKDALREALERRGTLSTLRAQVRREVFSAMEDGGDAQHPTPPENVVLNELIREYLEFNSARARASTPTRVSTTAHSLRTILSPQTTAIHSQSLRQRPGCH